MSRFSLVFVLLGLVLGAPAPPAAAADGTFNLAWNDCLGASGAQEDMTFACDRSQGPSLRLVVSFKPPARVPDFVGCSVVLVVQTAAETLPDWWSVGSQGCRAGALQVRDPGGLELQCSDPYGDATSTSSLAFWRDFYGTGNLRIQADLTRSSPVDLAAPVAGSMGYLALVMDLDLAGTTGETACAGCEVPGCIVLTTVRVGGASSGWTHIDEPEVRSFVTWQGGYPNCVGAVPTKSRTWGEVKALYR